MIISFLVALPAEITVMPIPRADLALRREVLVLFELCGIDPSAVLFADELDLPALQVSRKRAKLSIPAAFVAAIVFATNAGSRANQAFILNPA